MQHDAASVRGAWCMKYMVYLYRTCAMPVSTLPRPVRRAVCDGVLQKKGVSHLASMKKSLREVWRILEDVLSGSDLGVFPYRNRSWGTTVSLG